jgi:hypothetical protein
MKFIAVCVPTLGNVSIEWAQALRALVLPMNTGYCECFGKDDLGGKIAETRNAIVAKALSYESPEREITHLFWLDDDVICNRTAILALKRHDCDIASGVYFLKGDYGEPLIFPSRGGGTLPFVPDETFEVWGHGMGLTLVKLDVYKHMLDEGLPNDSCGRPQWYKTPGAEDAEVLHEVLFMGGTEDLYFLEAASKLGYKPLVDTSYGAFGWHYDAKHQIGYPKRQWEQYRKREPIVWDTPDGPVVWGSTNPRRPAARPTCVEAELVGDEAPHDRLVGDNS